MAFTTKQFDDIVSDMIAYIVSNSSKITDVTPGSVIRSFVEGTALSIEEVYVATYLGFQRYLNNIQETAFEFKRKSGVAATVNVIFSRTAPTGAKVTIPEGTRLKTASGLSFTTTRDGTIAENQPDSDRVPCKAEKVGSAYNIKVNTLTLIEDNLVGVDSVTNALPASGGVDAESDIAFKSRFQTYIEGLGRTNVAGLTSGALSVEGITSVSVVELFPPVKNVNVVVYVDDGSATQVSKELIAKVQDTIDGDGSEANPGYRAAGINIEVRAPAIVTANIVASLEVLAGVDTAQLRRDVISGITNYVNTLGVGKAIVYNEIIAAIMEVYGVSDVTSLKVGPRSENLVLAAAQVGRVGKITLSLE